MKFITDYNDTITINEDDNQVNVNGTILTFQDILKISDIIYGVDPRIDSDEDFDDYNDADDDDLDDGTTY